MATTEIVNLEVPARPAYVGVARTVAGAAAASVEGVEQDRMDDLRLAVSEAVNLAVELAPDRGHDEHLVLRCLVDDDHLELRIEGRTPPAAPATGDDTAPAERDWAVQLLDALVDQAELLREPSATTVRLVLRRSG
jgi:anti-sigma regulatory factor (Ser/Thr protein kinase)